MIVEYKFTTVYSFHKFGRYSFTARSLVYYNQVKMGSLFYLLFVSPFLGMLSSCTDDDYTSRHNQRKGVVKFPDLEDADIMAWHALIKRISLSGLFGFAIPSP